MICVFDQQISVSRTLKKYESYKAAQQYAIWFIVLTEEAVASISDGSANGCHTSGQFRFL